MTNKLNSKDYHIQFCRWMIENIWRSLIDLYSDIVLEYTRHGAEASKKKHLELRDQINSLIDNLERNKTELKKILDNDD